MPKTDNLTWMTVFVQDILHMTYKNTQKRNKKIEEQTVSIDLGWYPDGDWEYPILDFSSRNRAAIIETLEEWLFNELHYCNFIDPNAFRKAHHLPNR